MNPSPGDRMVCHQCNASFETPPSAVNSSYQICPQCGRGLLYSPVFEALSSHLSNPSEGDTPQVDDNATWIAPPPSGQPKDYRDNRELPPTPRRPYQVLNILGRGGCGLVYEVRDSFLPRPLAVKVILEHKRQKEVMKKRFLREILITSKLEHPNITPVHDAGFLDDGSLYLTMRKIGGSTLKDLLVPQEDKTRSTPLRKLILIFLKICHAVEYAHSQGVIHRDLKPSNVAIGEFGEVVVMDWGLAKYLREEDLPLGEEEIEQRRALGEELSMDGSMIGTPAYMPPEQANGKRELIGPRSDVYSLGAILYQILTLEPPYAGNPKKIITSLLLNPVVPPRVRSPHLNIPRPLEAVCLQALAKEVDDRYETVGQLIEDLHHYLDEEAMIAYLPPLGERAMKYLRRRAAAILVFAVLSLMLGVFSYFLARESEGRLVEQKKRIAEQKKRVEEQKKTISAQREKEKLVREKKEFYQDKLNAERAQRKAEKAQFEVMKKREEYMKKRTRAYSPYFAARDQMSRDMRFQSLKQVVIPRLVEALKILPKFIEARWELVKVNIYLNRPKMVLGQLMVIFQQLSRDKANRHLGKLIALAATQPKLLMKNRALVKKLEDSRPAFLPPLYWQVLKAILFSFAQHHDSALREVNKIAKLPEGQHWDVLLLKAMILRKAGRAREAIRILSDIIEDYPHVPYPYLTRATINKNLKRHQKALADYRTLAQLDPTNHLMWRNVAEVYRLLAKKASRVNMVEVALAHNLTRTRFLERSLALEPEFDTAKHEWNNALGDLAKALRSTPGEVRDLKQRWRLLRPYRTKRLHLLQKERALVAYRSRTKVDAREKKQLAQTLSNYLKSRSSPVDGRAVQSALRWFKQ